MFNKLRESLGRWLFLRDAAQFKKLMSKRNTRISVEAIDEDKVPLEPEKFYAWISSPAGRKETDIEFVLAIIEQLLQKIIAGEITEREMAELLAARNPFREMRTKNFVDTELAALIKQEEAPELALEDTTLKETIEAAPITAKTEAMHKALAFVQEVFKPTSAEDLEKEIKLEQKRKQWRIEQARIAAINKAALANSPEFLEQLGSDTFESESAQALRDAKVIYKEKTKLRGRLSKDELPSKIKIVKEKTPKELAEEKLKALRKLKRDLGGSASTSA